MVGQSGFTMDGLGGIDMGWNRPRFLAYNLHTSQDQSSNNVPWQQLLLGLSATDLNKLSRSAHPWTHVPAHATPNILSSFRPTHVESLDFDGYSCKSLTILRER